MRGTAFWVIDERKMNYIIMRPPVFWNNERLLAAPIQRRNLFLNIKALTGLQKVHHFSTILPITERPFSCRV